LVVTYTRNAFSGLLLVGITTDHVIHLPAGLIDFGNNVIRRVSNTQFVVIAASATSPRGLYFIDLNKRDKKLLKSSTSIMLDTAIFSEPKQISFPRTRGQNLDGLAHAIFTLPHNPAFSAPSNSKPPLIVAIHGGPTANTAPGLNLITQYWTTRGYAYVNINYAGSTGYGRAYRESLNYFWGIKDVDDAASCVDYLVGQGLVDGTSVGITGGSAGGYTVLQSMVTYPKLYAAGNSQYGIGNLRLLAVGTHKFESHYLFALLFPHGTPKDEQDKVYSARSPVEHAAKIENPLLLLQGDEDRVVPLDQAEEMEKTLREGGKDVRLVVFKGEGHGFRMQKHVKIAVEEEETLWRRTLLK
jgi:dipeptidyl aminopeptidase/acylaminoacyl peptidase